MKKKLNQRLGDARRLRFPTAGEAATALQIPLERYRSYERGTRLPSPACLKRMSEVFGVPIEWLIGSDIEDHC
jgi:transcriptional regulator with XRE-family HTH domain